ncbi:MAG: hypothetical protein IJ860_03130 [Eubacterium sp.]|nr:hypothetical protein [Eubacterium sp.]
MDTLSSESRKEFGERLKIESQESVMRLIPQFAEAQIHNLSPDVQQTAQEERARSDDCGILVFNMERGVHLEAIRDFLRDCPDVSPFDIILANELDDGCVRSGGLDTTAELAKALGLNYVYALEFIELANEADPKGFHGNAIFSRWPFRRARVVRLPEAYNWYFDRQTRIGGRCAILAEIEDGRGRHIGVGVMHLENRTDAAGRRMQMKTVLDAADEFFKEMPVILGGDLNTNTFDGRSVEDIGVIAADQTLRRQCLEDVFQNEPLLTDAEHRGYKCVPDRPVLTRRKPLPGGDVLGLRLDWIMARGMDVKESRMISTRRADFGFAKPGSALCSFADEELSDHNAVWAACTEADRSNQKDFAV